jgi:hypothetical protein
MKAVREAAGAPLGTGYEFQFRVESTNGAELTEIKYDYEVIKELI